jgi:excisionase family DNA binding protein
MGYTVPRALALRTAIEKPKRNSVELEQLLTLAEACGVLRISKNTLYDHIHRREIETIKLGRRRLIQPDAIRRFLNDRRATGVA